MNSSIASIMDTFRVHRVNMVKGLDGLTEQQLLFIPKGFNNNILWNFGHNIVSHQMLCYAKANVEFRIPTEFIDSFRKATSPADWKSNFDIEEMKKLALSTVDAFEEDLKKDAFSNYVPYLTSSGLELKNIDDAIYYNHLHEGYHLGVIASIKNILK